VEKLTASTMKGCFLDRRPVLWDIPFVPPLRVFCGQGWRRNRYGPIGLRTLPGRAKVICLGLYRLCRLAALRPRPHCRQSPHNAKGTQIYYRRKGRRNPQVEPEGETRFDRKNLKGKLIDRSSYTKGPCNAAGINIGFAGQFHGGRRRCGASADSASSTTGDNHNRRDYYYHGSAHIKLLELHMFDAGPKT
jgi:hypothetical protein